MPKSILGLESWKEVHKVQKMVSKFWPTPLFHLQIPEKNAINSFLKIQRWSCWNKKSFHKLFMKYKNCGVWLSTTVQAIQKWNLSKVSIPWLPHLAINIISLWIVYQETVFQAWWISVMTVQDSALFLMAMNEQMHQWQPCNITRFCVLCLINHLTHHLCWLDFSDTFVIKLNENKLIKLWRSPFLFDQPQGNRNSLS